MADGVLFCRLNVRGIRNGILRASDTQKTEVFVMPDGVEFSLGREESLGLIGESGSGKTQTAQCIFGVNRAIPGVFQGDVEYHWDRRGVLRLYENVGADWEKRGEVDVSRALRWKALVAKRRQGLTGRVGMVFQDPLEYLNPLWTIRQHFADRLRGNSGTKRLSRQAVDQEACRLLRQVGFHDTFDHLSKHPSQLSGGMSQRLLLALTLVSRPQLLILDEPTTGLDILLQVRMIKLLESFRQRAGADHLSLIVISHDLGLIKRLTERVVGVRGGRIVHDGATSDVIPAILNGGHCIFPDYRVPSERSRPEHAVRRVILSAKGIGVRFCDQHSKHGKDFWAVRKVGLDLHEGEIVALVGESGCGKTTFGRVLVKLIHADEGRIRLGEVDVTNMTQSLFRPMRRRMQMIFQNPYAALNPAMKVREILTQAIRLHGDVRITPADILNRVGLAAEKLECLPRQLSGGERRLVGLGRIIIFEPEVIIADEPVSSLDISAKARVLDVLFNTTRGEKRTYLWISHDLELVSNYCDRLVVMFGSRIVEMMSNRDADLSTVIHPYTQALFEAAKVLYEEDGKSVIAGSPSDEHLLPNNHAELCPPGCVYFPRCALRSELGEPPECRSAEEPVLRETEPGSSHWVACHVRGTRETETAEHET